MPKSEFLIKACSGESQQEWSMLRAALWPDCSEEEHKQDMQAYLGHPERFAQFMAYDGKKAVGFIEASLRYDYVNGTCSSPVAFVEGLYIIAEMRRRGIATALVKEVERWAQEKGCEELASDVLIDNVASLRAHKALGFDETERVVYFRKELK